MFLKRDVINWTTVILIFLVGVARCVDPVLTIVSITPSSDCPVDGVGKVLIRASIDYTGVHPGFSKNVQLDSTDGTSASLICTIPITTDCSTNSLEPCHCESKANDVHQLVFNVTADSDHSGRNVKMLAVVDALYGIVVESINTLKYPFIKASPKTIEDTLLFDGNEVSPVEGGDFRDDLHVVNYKVKGLTKPFQLNFRSNLEGGWVNKWANKSRLVVQLSTAVQEFCLSYQENHTCPYHKTLCFNRRGRYTSSFSPKDRPFERPDRLVEGEKQQSAHPDCPCTFNDLHTILFIVCESLQVLCVIVGIIGFNSKALEKHRYCFLISFTTTLVILLLSQVVIAFYQGIRDCFNECHGAFLLIGLGVTFIFVAFVLWKIYKDKDQHDMPPGVRSVLLVLALTIALTAAAGAFCIMADHNAEVNGWNVAYLGLSGFFVAFVLTSLGFLRQADLLEVHPGEAARELVNEVGRRISTSTAAIRNSSFRKSQSSPADP